MGTGGSFPGCKAAVDVKMTIQVHLVPRSIMVELYLHSPVGLHGVVVFNWLSMGNVYFFSTITHHHVAAQTVARNSTILAVSAEL
jgi:hypothetical protein